MPGGGGGGGGGGGISIHSDEYDAEMKCSPAAVCVFACLAQSQLRSLTAAPLGRVYSEGS